MLNGSLEVVRDVAMATKFLDAICYCLAGFVGYNFGCMMASDTLFDSRGGFSGSRYPKKT